MTTDSNVSADYALLCASAGELQFNIKVLEQQLQQTNVKINEWRLAEQKKQEEGKAASPVESPVSV